MTDCAVRASSSALRGRLVEWFCVFVSMILLSVTSAFATQVPNQCRVERQDAALAACLELAFDQRVVKMSQTINDMLAHLQAATPRELLALQQQYGDSQDVWLVRLTEECERLKGSDVVAVQKCRLSALSGREERLALSLSRAADDFGAPLSYSVPTPKQIEIHIPLAIPLPFAGTAEIPLLLPISPD